MPLACGDGCHGEEEQSFPGFDLTGAYLHGPLLEMYAMISSYAKAPGKLLHLSVICLSVTCLCTVYLFVICLSSISIF